MHSKKNVTMEDNFAIQLFEGNKVRIVWDEEQEKYYFSVVDIVQVLTGSVDAKQYIKRLRTRDPELNLKWGTICTPVEMKAFDGKKRKIQAAQAGGKVAKNAREDLESQLGSSVISSERASDHIRPIEEGKAQEL